MSESKYSHHNHLGGFSSDCAECNPPSAAAHGAGEDEIDRILQVVIDECPAAERVRCGEKSRGSSDVRAIIIATLAATQPASLPADSPLYDKLQRAGMIAQPTPRLHCSCGAAVTEPEYAEHRAMGHDAGEQAVTEAKCETYKAGQLRCVLVWSHQGPCEFPPTTEVRRLCRYCKTPLDETGAVSADGWIYHKRCAPATEPFAHGVMPNYNPVGTTGSLQAWDKIEQLKTEIERLKAEHAIECEELREQGYGKPGIKPNDEMCIQCGEKFSGVRCGCGTASLVSERTTRPVMEASAVLDFEKWALRWCADNGRKLTITEYGIAMAAFYSAHPAEGPFSSTMSVPAPEVKCELCGHNNVIQGRCVSESRNVPGNICSCHCQFATPESAGRVESGEKCHAQMDGDCEWEYCPQEANSRANYQSHCPLDTWEDPRW